MPRSDRIVVAAGGGAVILALAAAGMVMLPAGGHGGEAGDAAMLLLASPSPSVPASARAEDAAIVVDVEGAVAQPGIRRLPAGSRVADAIAAAGGYATDANLDATATTINLAKALTDGEQIVVPRVGDGVQPASATPGGGNESATGGGGPGLVDLNSATPEQLEALPGIGAVTVQKIVAARQERPFASLEDAVERGVIHRGQLEDIQGLATAG